jgi:hypothetical protein
MTTGRTVPCRASNARRQKYLVRKYSDQKEIKTNLGDLLKKALEKK